MRVLWKLRRKLAQTQMGRVIPMRRISSSLKNHVLQLFPIPAVFDKIRGTCGSVSTRRFFTCHCTRDALIESFRELVDVANLSHARV